MADLNDMLIFAKVAELEGISPAARALKMAKSRVSRRMATLEESLGARLLERSTRAVHLTEVGRVYYQHCKRIAEEADHAQQSISRMTDMPRGLLRISTSLTLGQYLIAPHLAEFVQQYPEIEIEMDLSNRRVDMIAEGFDLVFRVGELPDSNLVSKRVGGNAPSLYASADYLAGQGALKKPHELSRHKVLVMPDSGFVYQWPLQNKKGELETVVIKPAISVNDFSTLKVIAEGGGGIACLPRYVAEDSVQQGKLVNVLPEWQLPKFDYHLLYPSHRGLALKARVWIDFFVDKLPK